MCFRDSPDPWPQLSHARALENLSNLLGEFGRRWHGTQLDSIVGEQAGTDAAQRRQLLHCVFDVLVHSFSL